MPMRAFAVDRFGDTGSIHDLPIPTPGEGEVLVRVRAAGVNVMDPMYVAGWLKDYMEHRFPLVAGIDLSGVVEAIGPGVSGFAPGDEVYGVSAKPFVGEGTFAEYTVAPASALAPKPAGLTDAQAAAVPHVGLTALAAIDAADPQQGQILVLVGAAGGVGSFTSQLASERGARVVAVTGPESAAQAKSLGAAETVDYTAGDPVELIKERYPEGVDAVIDFHSDADEFARFGSLIRPGGVAVSTRGPAGAAAPELEKRGVRFAPANRAAPERLSEITTALESGRLQVPPVKTYPLEQASDAITEMAAGHVRGKLAITVD
jgi:NADPH:quinone reductase-like Zn-dependent oxidoreductase